MQKFTIKRNQAILTQYELEVVLGAVVYCEELKYDLSNQNKKEVTLTKNHTYYLGALNESGRGIEFTILDDVYEVAISSLSTLQDWKYAINLISNLANANDSLIINEEDETYDSQTIFEYDYYLKMEETLDVIYKNLIENKVEIISLYGINYTQFIDKDIIIDMYESADLLVSFSNFILERQWIDCGVVEQKLLQDDLSGQIHSFYAIYASTPLILPLRPVVDVGFLMQGIKHEDVEKFNLLFLDEDANLIAEINHEYLEDILPKNKYKKIDALNILVDSLSVDELMQLHLDAVNRFENTDENKQ